MGMRWRTDAALMVSIVAVFCALSVVLGERIGINGGQGWDGMGYTAWAEQFWQRVMVEHLTWYHSQRVLPSAIVHYGLRVAGRPTDAAHVIAGFQVLDSAMLILTAGLWAHLGAAMSWRRAARWVGFVALFGGFANARHALYYPTLTDPTACALGMVLAWGYLTDRRWAVWVAGALGTLTWPALLPIAMVMLLLPRSPAGAQPAAAGNPARAARAAAVLAAAGAAGFLLAGGHYLLHPVPAPGVGKFAEWVRRDLLIVTVPGLAALLGIGGYVLLRDPRLFDLRDHLARLRRGWRGSVPAVASLIALHDAWVGAIGTRGEGPSGAQFLCEHTLAALRGPLWGPVHHVVYFGPIILVAVMAWKRIARVANDLGPGAVIALAMTLGFAAGSQSRQWIHLLPFLVAMTVAATEPWWTARRAIVFAAVALPWSKLWLKIGYDRHVFWLDFPNQRYFMNQGPWASDAMYLVHLAAAVITALVLGLVLRTAAAEERPDPPGPDRAGATAATGE